MPYSYKKIGNKYCVFNKNTGKKMGCTHGDKASLKRYLTALYINAKESKTEQLKEGIKNIIRELLKEGNTVIMRSKIVNEPIDSIIKKDIGLKFDDKEKQEVKFKEGTLGIKAIIINNNTEIKFSTSDMFGNNKVNIIKKLRNMSDSNTLVYVNYFSAVPQESEEKPEQPPKNSTQPQEPKSKPEEKSKTYVKISQPFDDKGTDKLDILNDFLNILDIK